MKRLRQILQMYPDQLAVLGLIVSPVLFLFDVLWTHSRTFFVGLDNVHQFFAWYQHFSQSIHHGQIPWWDNSVLGGKSFVGEFQTGVLYPINYIWVYLFGNGSGISELALNWLVALHFSIAAAGAYILIRQLRIGGLPAVLGALVYAFSGSVLARSTGQICIFFGLAWIPLAVAVAVIAARQITLKRQALWGFLAGGVMGLAVLAGHMQPFVHGLMAITAVVAGIIYARHRFWRQRCVAFLRVMCAVAVGAAVIAGPQLYLGYRWLEQAYRLQTNGYALIGQKETLSSFVSTHILRISDMGNFLSPGSVTDNGSLFIGVFPLAVLVAWLWLRLKLPPLRHDVAAKRAVFATGWFGILAAFGYLTPVAAVIYYIPLLGSIVRAPERYIVLMHLALSVLFAAGIDQILNWRKIKQVKYPSWLPVSMIAVGLVWGYFYYKLGWVRVDPILSLHAAFMGLGIAGVLLVGRSKLLAVMCLVIALAGGSVANVHRITSRLADGARVEVIYQRTPIISFVEQRAYAKYRVTAETDTVPVNVGDVYRIETKGGYGATIYASYFDFIQQNKQQPYITDDIADKENDYLGVRYVISKHKMSGLDEVYTDSTSRIYVYDRHHTAAKLELRSVFDGGVFSDNSSLNFSAVQYQDQRQIYDVNLAQAAEIVSNDSSAPGWEAYIDGSRTSLRAYGPNGFREGARPFRLVSMPAGKHRLEFRYNPLGS